MLFKVNKDVKWRYLFNILSFFFSINCIASTSDDPPHIGNFSLPYSQQPGPLVGFGENILAKNQTQLFMFADDFMAVNEHFIDVIPSVIYGLSDSASVFVNIPYAASYKQNNNYSTGFEDAFIQLEYAFYTKGASDHIDQATVVFNQTFPTGSTIKNPPTGFGVPSYFLGFTYNRTYIHWFAFTSYGADFTTTTHDGTKFGNSYLYQFGFGRDIAESNKWLFAWMVEGDGTFTEQSKINGVINHSSGGNIVYMTPSIWISSEKLIFQFGAGYPITQHFFGIQNRDKALLVANLGWTIW